MNWFSLDSVILIIYSDLQLFAIFILGEIDFSETYETYLMSAENNSRLLASKFDPPYKARAFGTRDKRNFGQAN